MTKQKAQDRMYVAQKIVQERITLREAEKRYGIPKSTVYHFISTKLYYMDRLLYSKVCDQLHTNRQQGWHLGGKRSKRKKKER